MSTVTQQVNEGSTAYLTIEFADKDGLPAVPNTVTYRIDCMTTGTAILASTSLTPASSLEITLSATYNRIIAQDNKYEKRLVTVVAGYAGSEALTSEYTYLVKNLSKVT